MWFRVGLIGLIGPAFESAGIFFVDHMHHLGCVSMLCSVEYIHGPYSFGSHAWLHSHNWCGCTDTIQWWWGCMHTTTSPPHHLPPCKGSEIMIIGICIGGLTGTQLLFEFLICVFAKCCGPPSWTSPLQPGLPPPHLQPPCWGLALLLAPSPVFFTMLSMQC